jgi:hypothetical protein
MSSPDGAGAEAGRTWRDRIAAVLDSAQSLIATRLEIFQAELGAKARLLGKGLAATAAAAALGFGAMLLFAALLAALLAQLFDNVALGILAAMVLYLAGAAGAGYFAWKALSRVEPGEFPATSRELARDVDAIRAALAREPDPEEGPDRDDGQDAEDADEGDVRDLEARLRAGAE